MEKTMQIVFLSLLVAGSLLLGKASPALSGDAAEESGGQRSSRAAHRGASPATELIAGSRPTGTVSAAGNDPDRSHTPTAGELVGAVVANELMDREKRRKWICMIEKRAGKQTLTEVQIETKDGPLYRLLAIDGTALNRGQRQQDDARIGRLMTDPRSLLKLKQAQEEDELKLEKLMSLMPEAFVYDYDGVEENLLRVKFSPNPKYNPPTYEARVVHSLAGTILIDSEQNRLAKVAVGPQEWKTAFINIHFSGRAVIFKTINKEQYERRSDFRAVSSDLSLADAKDLLISRLPPPPQTP